MNEQERVASVLRGLVRQLPAGTRLPSQHDLADELRVSRTTVQKALDVLRKEGLIVTAQGSGSFVAEAAGREGPESWTEPTPAIRALPELLEVAFREPHVTIDYYGLTAETLNMALNPRLVALRTREEAAPESIAIRLLLPSVDTRLAVPRSTTDPADERPLVRLRELIAAHALTLVNSVTSLRTDGLVPEVSTEVRTVPVTPLQKVYVVNGRHVLHGVYKIVERTLPDEGLTIYDVLGLEAKMMPAESSTALIFADWFESIWTTVASDHTLGE